jgi:hypothetical protein
VIALLLPRLTSAPLAPSWAAVERVLYLVALSAALRPTADDGAAVVSAWRALDARMQRDWTALVSSAPVDGARGRRWIVAARDAARAEVAALGCTGDAAVTARAAVLVWAAVASWTDAPSGRWGELATLAAVLAEELDGAVLDGGHEAETGRAACGLRAVMATGWSEMEAGR